LAAQTQEWCMDGYMDRTNEEKRIQGENMKCLQCGKEMVEVMDSKTKTFTGYNWHCDTCMPTGVVLSIL
jgi:hypothetical protein